MRYVNKHEIVYYSKRFNRFVRVEKGFVSDGASSIAIDIWSYSWWVHDKLCSTWKWEDGTRCSNWQASWVISDILKSEGRWFRAFTWFVATLIGGPVYRFIKKLRRKIMAGKGDKPRKVKKSLYDKNFDDINWKKKKKKKKKTV